MHPARTGTARAGRVKPAACAYSAGGQDAGSSGIRNEICSHSQIAITPIRIIYIYIIYLYIYVSPRDLHLKPRLHL